MPYIRSGSVGNTENTLCSGITKQTRLAYSGIARDICKWLEGSMAPRVQENVCFIISKVFPRTTRPMCLIPLR